jgi:pyridoxine 5-phosphate synthase
VVPDQCTLVPVVPGEITSQAGWQRGGESDRLPAIVARLHAAGIRVSLFVDPLPDPIRWAASTGADRVELYTEPFARAFERGRDEGRRSLASYVEAAELAHTLGLGVNAGHDLDLANLTIFRELPFLDEVSIGHAIMSRALYVGLSSVVHEYLALLGGASGCAI